jgi:hypothetical protein
VRWTPVCIRGSWGLLKSKDATNIATDSSNRPVDWALSSTSPQFRAPLDSNGVSNSLGNRISPKPRTTRSSQVSFTRSIFSPLEEQPMIDSLSGDQSTQRQIELTTFPTPGSPGSPGSLCKIQDSESEPRSWFEIPFLTVYLSALFSLAQQR